MLADSRTEATAELAHAERQAGANREELDRLQAWEAASALTPRAARSRSAGDPSDRCHTYPEVLIRVRLLKLRRGFAA
jgi:hypothetical protein